MLIGGLESAYVDLRDPTHLRLDYVRRMADASTRWSGAASRRRSCTSAAAASRCRARSRRRGRPPARRSTSSTRRSWRWRAATCGCAATRPRPARPRRRRPGPARAPRRGLRRPRRRRCVRRHDVPAHLATPEFVTQVRRALRPGGRYLLNAIDAPPHAWARAQAATLATVFAHVAVFGRARSSPAGAPATCFRGERRPPGRPPRPRAHPSVSAKDPEFAGGTRPS